MTTIAAKRIFDGNQWLVNHTVEVVDGIIAAIRPTTPKDGPSVPLLVPAFVDAQIYGASGRLLSVFPDTTTILAIREYSKKGGAAAFLPTVATHPTSIIHACIDAVRKYWEQGLEGCLGLHVEGPWMHPLKRGAHVEEWVHPPVISEVKALLEYGAGVIKMITLAPEITSPEIIALIQSYDIIISAGHSNATLQESQTGFGLGIPAVTHLFNAMSGCDHRNPGLAIAALSNKQAMSSIIPDGIHVHPQMIALAYKLLGRRLFAITDAVTNTNTGPYQHTFSGDHYTSKGILSGSALTMLQACNNLQTLANVSEEDALWMCSAGPAELLKVSPEFGFIQENRSAHLLALTEDWRVIFCDSHEQ